MPERMTIASALRRIKNIKGQIAEHKSRSELGVSYTLDKVPSFRFKEEVDKYIAATNELLDLESKVAIANANTLILDGGEDITLAEAIRTLQEIKGMIAFYRDLNLKSGLEKNRVRDWDEEENKSISRVEEITYICDLSEIERDAKIRSLQNHFEVLNNSVEDKNHVVLI